MNAEIITIGTELLLGQIVDTNAAWLAQQLAAVGLNLYRKTTVGDNEARIAAVIAESLARVDVVITSGGLGPTVDDMTREAVARATNRPLVLDPGLLEAIGRIFERRGFTMSENNRRQAFIPEGAIPIPNPVGTAPCFAVPVERDGRTRYVISLPGVPRELKHMMTHAVIPLLRDKLQLTDTIRSRILRAAGITESRIDQLIGDLEREENPTVGLAAHAGQIDVRITARASSDGDVNRMLDAMEVRVRERLNPYIFGTDNDTLEGVVVRTLADQGFTLAIVETNTIGRIVQRLAQAGVQSGANVLKESIVATTPDVLRRVSQTDSDHDLITREAAIRAADYVRELNQADIGLAVIASLEALDPYGETPGVTHVALTRSSGHSLRQLRFGGTSELAVNWAVNHSLDLLRRELLGIPPDNP